MSVNRGGRNICFTITRIGISVVSVYVHRNNFCVFIGFAYVYNTLLITEGVDQMYKVVQI
jgi:hypothetical protein